MRMKKEHFEAWMTALRSGEYEQGKGALQTVGKDGKATFCCWGVFCDLAVKAGVPVTVSDSHSMSAGKYVVYDGATAYPPESVMEWAGVEHSEDLPVGLPARWNDAAGPDAADFSTIADRLEERVTRY